MRQLDPLPRAVVLIRAAPQMRGGLSLGAGHAGDRWVVGIDIDAKYARRLLDRGVAGPAAEKP